MIEVGPPPKPPPASGAVAAPPPRLAAGAIPVQLLEPATLPESLPANAPVPALVEPGSQAGILGDVLQLSTDQGPLTIQSPLMLAAGTRVTLQLATIAGRMQLFLIPPRTTPETRGPTAKQALAAAAKPALQALLPGRAVIATVVRAAPRGGDNAAPTAARPLAAEEPAAQGAEPAAAAASDGAPAAASELPSATAAELPAAAPAAASVAANAPSAPNAGPPNQAAPSAVAAEESPVTQAATGEESRAASPAAPSAALAALAVRTTAQPFAGMAAGQQVTLTILSIGGKAAVSAQIAEPEGQSASTAPAAAAQSNAVASEPGSRPVEAPNAAALDAPAARAAPASPLASTAAAPAKPIAAGAQIQSPPPAAPPAPAPAPAQAALSEVPAAAAGTAGTAPAQAPLALPPEAIAIPASVVGSDAAGQPIVEAGPVLLVLQAKAPPVGSEIMLALPRAASEAAPAPAQIFAPLDEVARQASSQGGALQQAVEALLPRPGPALAAQLALYAGALRQGALTSWLGKAASDELDKIGKGRAAQRLAAAFGEAARTSSGAERTTGWLSLTLPLVEAGLIQPIQLYVQRRRDEEEKSPEKPDSEQGRRFLIDFTLTRLGGIQLDGLARSNKLDLIVRSLAPMESALRTDLDRLFADVTSARGLAGTLTFQVAPPVTPVARPLPQPPAGGILV